MSAEVCPEQFLPGRSRRLANRPHQWTRGGRCLFCDKPRPDADAPIPLGHFNAGTDPQGVNAYDPKVDRARLTGQILRIFDLVRDGEWRTLGEIETATGDPPASISAQLRHLRKDRFGGHVVEKRRRGEPAEGLWEYRLIENPGESVTGSG